MKSYYTVSHNSETEYIIQKSKFIGRCFSVASEDEALKYIGEVRKKHWDATHNCYAYVCGENGETARYSDDGEPSGTAGLPMIDVIRKRNITNTLCVVTRYFGGILLGVGGLVRAYTKSTSDALNEAGLSKVCECNSYRLAVPYALWTKTENCLKLKTVIDHVSFLEIVYVDVSLPADKAEDFVGQMTDLSDGKVIPEFTGSEMRLIQEE